MKDRISELLEEVSKLSAENAEQLEALRIKYLSKKGEISSLFNDFKNVAADQKREIGGLLNELKTKATERIAEMKAEFEAKQAQADALEVIEERVERAAFELSFADRFDKVVVNDDLETAKAEIERVIKEYLET